MDENHQNKIASKQTATEDKSQLLPLSSKDEEVSQKDEKRAQKELTLLHKRLNKDRKNPKQLLIIVGISAAFVGVVLIYSWFMFNWPLWLLMWLILIGVGVELLVLLIRAGYTAQWTGFKGKTLWDWLQLLGVLAIPIVVAGATLLFGIQQANLANQQHENDQKIANQQYEADKQSALGQQEATILQTYIDNIQDLLLNHNLLGDSPTPNNDSDKVKIQEVQELARARTLTALQGLDSYRRGVLLKFLYEAKLIGFLDNNSKTHDPIINLILADLSGADLSGAHNLTQQQLDQVKSCKGATLPKGLTCHHNQSTILS
jgi:hypothetical protein